jgi:exodeoxyribonuclease V gamma subunit
MTTQSSMPRLRRFTSNCLENLAEALADVLRKSPAHPLAEEIIVVQSKGMERWVSMELARHHGICANVRFPFPKAFVYEVFQKALKSLPERFLLDSRLVAWKIMKRLPACVRRKGFESLRNYLAGSGDQLKRFQLSERIAETFVEYLTFRPEMILAWEDKQEDHWQAVLWRELVKDDEHGHGAGWGKAFLEAVTGGAVDKAAFPERVSVFGISALPRFHMQILAAMARFTEVNLFLMNPCKAYWGDIVSDWEMEKGLAKESGRELSIDELHFEKGNSLLASMGRLGRDFFELVGEFDCEEEITAFHEPGEETLLSCIQSDILNLRDRGQNGDTKKLVPAREGSIQIHACHSPMREIEVLYDWLLDRFEQDAGLMPKDVLVMMPDIETYAPYIQAVFDVPADEARRFPFSIADRSVRQESEIVDTFLSIMDLCESRFGSSRVLSVLDSPAVQRRFGLCETDLEAVRRWVDETGIRWGIDVASLSALGLPAFGENTWRAGIEKLLLGYALPGQDEQLFRGILPYDRIEGGEAGVLGRFVEFAEQLIRQVTALQEPRTLTAWSDALTGVLDRFFLPEQDTESDVQVIRRTLRDLAATQELSGFDEKTDVRVIRHHLQQRLAREGFGFGFITGGITFCAMLPMRSIPFKIICLVGMNGDAFPRGSKRLGFDLITRHPRRGDRSRRHDDRYLFLEAILSARETLYVSYVGQSLQDNSPIPPSVLLGELMDYIEQGFEMPGETILECVLTRHRLQAFSPAYFKGDEKLFSYSEANCKAAEYLIEKRQEPTPFITKGLAEPEEAWKTIDLEQLCSFFGNPTKYLLNRRLGIHFEERGSILEEKEPFDIKGLEKYLLEQKLAARRLSGGNLKAFFAVERASGRLPHGTIGECVYETLCAGVRRFVEMTRPFMAAPRLEPLGVALDLSGFRVTGTIHAMDSRRLIQYRYAKAKPKDRLRIWIHHLVLNCTEAKDYPRTSMLIALTPAGSEPAWAAWEYAPVENSKALLTWLLETYWEGMMRPLPFFPLSSWEYAQGVLVRNKPEPEALNMARHRWTGSDFFRGECEDPYYQLCFNTQNPLDSAFQQIAEKTFGPLIEREKEVKPITSTSG